MGRLTQNSFLGEASTRLQRVLDLDGVLSLGLEDGIVPVVIIGDGTGPGMSSFRGRRFMFQFNGLATGTNVALTAALPPGRCVVDQFEASFTGLGAAGGDRLSLYQYQAGTAAPLVPTGNAVAQFTDDFRGDYAPVLVGSGAGAPTVPAIGSWVFGPGTSLAPLVVPCEIGIVNPTILTWRWTAVVAGSLDLTVHGRVF